MNKDVNILVLDDDADILNSLKRLYRNEPFGIATTENAEVAMDIIGKENIKVILCDQRMPKISGIDFLRKVKEKYPDIKRIIFTGHPDVFSAEEAINASEVYRFINKPWNGDELKTAVSQAIQHYDLLIENRKLFELTKEKNKELEIINRKLKAVYEIQKEFLLTVSEKLSQPIASIKKVVEMVLRGTISDCTEKQENFLDKIDHSIEQLDRLMNDTLNFSELETGKLDLNLQYNSIQDVINSVIEEQQSVAERKGLHLIPNDIHLDIPSLPLDADRIRQVLMNMISNAIKFTEKGGINVFCFNHQEANHIEVCVKDTGLGIREDDMPMLFQRFHGTGKPVTRERDGAGLGLAISREIIKQHGGKVWAKSEWKKGSEFYFVLPINERRSD